MEIEIDDKTCYIVHKTDELGRIVYEVRGKVRDPPGDKATHDRYIDDLKQEITALNEIVRGHQSGETLRQVVQEREQAVTELARVKRQLADTIADRNCILDRTQRARNERHAADSLRLRVAELETQLESCKQGQVRAEKQWQHVGHTDPLSVFDDLEAPLVAEIQSYEAPRVVRVVTTYEYSDGASSEIG